VIEMPVGVVAQKLWDMHQTPWLNVITKTGPLELLAI